MKGLQWRKAIAIFIIVAIAVNMLIGCHGGSDQEAFDAFIEQEFVDSLEENWLYTHIYTENPEDFGIDISKVPVEISPSVTDDYLEEVHAKNKEKQEAFKSFKWQTLTDTQKDTYDIYAFMLDNAIEASRDEYKYFSFDFATLNGSYCQIPTLLADLQLRCEDDIKALIKLVESVKVYLDSSSAFLKEQEAHGTLMIDIDGVRSYCENLVAVGMESSTLVSMKENIDTVDISQDLKNTYKAELEVAFERSYLPAYENIIWILEQIDASKNVEGGMANMTYGRSAYEILFRVATGTSKSVGEVQKMLEGMLQDAIADLQALAASNLGAYLTYMKGDVSTGYKNFEEILKDLNEAIEDDFPDAGEMLYDIRSLPKDLEHSGVLAYYNTPALDHSGKQHIRVNTAADSLNLGDVETFMTVAHEGIPGHMYQFNYCYNLDLPNWRKTIAVSDGFAEGYATYVQMYALKYLEDMDEGLLELYRLMTVIDDMAVALADIGIHYEGWSVSELADYFNSVGLSGDAADDIYDQLRANPTAFLSYYVGYAEIMNLREKAEKALGSAFDDKKFHTALLASGGGTFEVVERCINKYIESVN